MQIIVEGADNSGKSTLANFLGSNLNLPVIRGEGPPKSTKEINERAKSWLNIQGDCIFDRHPCTSNPIYDRFRKAAMPIDPDILNEFYRTPRLMIYCASRSLDGHQEKEYDRRAGHAELVASSHERICQLYDQWSIKHAQLVYRIGDDYRMLLWMITAFVKRFDPHADVAAFHQKFDLVYDGPPRPLPADLMEFRIKTLREEVDEYAHSCHLLNEYLLRFGDNPDSDTIARFLDDIFDALIDLDYFSHGTAYLHGFPYAAGWHRVHEANMKKVRAQKASDSKRGSTHDVVKPDGWKPPTHIDLVADHAYAAK